ncbi:hypothetical protein VTH06DRAFT_299 [Thermothelomyces fergusii]
MEPPAHPRTKTGGRGRHDGTAQSTFFCPTTGSEIADPLGPCGRCRVSHDLIWQSVFVCPNTGYRVERAAARPGADHRECPACFQMHRPYSKRVYVCPVTGATIAHPRNTGGRCQKCGRSHEDNPTPVGSREAVSERSP